MKLVVVTSGFLPVPATKGGAVENIIVNLLNENENEKKIDFTIISIKDEKACAYAKKYNNVDFIFIQPSLIVKILDCICFFIAKNIFKKENSQSYRYIFQRLFYLNKSSKILKKENFDKVLLENHPTQFLALKWRKNYIKYADRYYYHCHNEFPGTYGCEEIMKKASKYICVSQFIGDTIKEKLNIEDDKVCVLRNCVNKEKFNGQISEKEKISILNKYNIKSDEKILLFTGRITPEKGIKELIEALNYVKTNKYKLLILGSALNNLKTKTKFQKEIEELVVENSDSIIFTGYVNYEDISKYYALADIAVLPSIWNDPAPLTIIESLTSGLPIITTRSGGIPEYAINGSAIILERDDNLIKNLSDSINQLINDNSKLSNMSKIAKEVSKELTLENYFDNFIKLIGEDDE